MMKIDSIIKHRSSWMGIAILWVILFHANIEFPYGVLNEIKVIGYGGVDIFMFASGMGCYFSLSRDNDVLSFLKRRFMRIMPIYWCFIVVWLIYKSQYIELTVGSVIGNVLCVQYFTELGNDFNWYISAIWLLYLLAPALKSLVDNIDSLKKGLLYVGLIILVTIPFIKGSFLIMVTRVPIFFMGMCLAKMGYKDIKIRKRDILLIGSVALIGFFILEYFIKKHYDLLWPFGLWWYPFILMTPGLCIGISYIIMCISKYKLGNMIKRIIEKIGESSFELYLVHIFVYDIAAQHVPDELWGEK